MISRSYRPRQPLADLVESFWYYDGYYLPHAQELVLPHNAMQLLISLQDDIMRVFDRPYDAKPYSLRGPLICGPYTRPFVIDAACRASIICVQFKPGGAAPFLGVPASELGDAHVPLDVLWGASACELRDRVLDATTPEVRFQIIEQALLAHLPRSLARHPAVAVALREFQGGPHMRPVSDLVAYSGLNARRFIQVFSAEVGQTPKLFCRIQRFQGLLRHMHAGRQSSGADLAATYGYCDQSHLIHDFRAFTGLTPTEYLTQRGDHHNHVLLRA